MWVKWIRSNKGGVTLTTAMIIQRTNYNLVSSRRKNTCEHIDQEATLVWFLPVGITRSWSALVHMVSGFVKMWPKMFANPSSYLILQDVKSKSTLSTTAAPMNIFACFHTYRITAETVSWIIVITLLCSLIRLVWIALDASIETHQGYKFDMWTINKDMSTIPLVL